MSDPLTTESEDIVFNIDDLSDKVYQRIGAGTEVRFTEINGQMNKFQSQLELILQKLGHNTEATGAHGATASNQMPAEAPGAHVAAVSNQVADAVHGTAAMDISVAGEGDHGSPATQIQKGDIVSHGENPVKRGIQGDKVSHGENPESTHSTKRRRIEDDMISTAPSYGFLPSERMYNPRSECDTKDKEPPTIIINLFSIG